MRTYDFDKTINRISTNSMKYDYPENYGYTKQHIPLWIADMDYPACEEIKNAIANINAMGVYGYTGISDTYYKTVAQWMRTRHNFKVEKEWHIVVPTTVYALSIAICAFSKPEEGILIQTPVYSPFYKVINLNKRKIVRNPLVYDNGKYIVDYKDFEEKIVNNNVKVFILCNPHNPVGKVFTKGELLMMCHICCKHKVIIVSDEVHHDFIYEPHKHTMITNLNTNFEQNSIVCTSPSKTFNIAGLKIANVFIPNPELRQKFNDEANARSAGGSNTLAMAACVAAYRYGANWLKQLKEYIKGNLDYVSTFIDENLPKIKLVKPEGTYLVWLDCTGMGLTNKQINSFFKDDAKLWLNPGDIFGSEGEGFQRVNIATSRSVLEKAMNNVKTAYDVLYHTKSH